MKRFPSYVVVVSAALALAALTAGSPLYTQNVQQQLDDLKAQVATLQATVKTLQTQLANAQNVLALDPFVRVDPKPQLGVAGPNITFSGVNLHLVSGSGATDDGGHCRGLGNLIIGYDEDPSPRFTLPEPLKPSDRGGSHNLVIGAGHRFTQVAFGGLLAGESNTLTAGAASISGGQGNTVSGWAASVSGGSDNTASSQWASVSGGSDNTASGEWASVTGGRKNTASGVWASVSGGAKNTASGEWASVSGGADNTASGEQASVSGGEKNTASGNYTVVLGGYWVTNKNHYASIAPQPPFP